MVMVLLVSCTSAAEVEATAVARPLRAYRRRAQWVGHLAPRGCTALPCAAHPPVHGVRVNGASRRDRLALLRDADTPWVTPGDPLQPRLSLSAAFDCAKIGGLPLREVRPT
jgi:hypothetical protein